mmetsp:Transcript_62070/g.72185  ORF Transcript_62070/g.72185 Transcript_62070/m.72185 type:complete len:130 (+) Transcript_62070:65-454(+)|eukprot:CAMPEP_0176425258 /NCGR_PEP_ID=MMETSP0127-20121128/11293_1 /TAXON_ID=938130 /ORGANISM="Platyophrya macrostoma, Strain WH" /LENGTH=129 /DNA_ID=CAMNT_0017806407 /DNA_START=61 /DNA_END=450 /DNA_ORIENTATION=+
MEENLSKLSKDMKTLQQENGVLKDQLEQLTLRVSVLEKVAQPSKDPSSRKVLVEELTKAHSEKNQAEFHKKMDELVNGSQVKFDDKPCCDKKNISEDSNYHCVCEKPDVRECEDRYTCVYCGRPGNQVN